MNFKFGRKCVFGVERSSLGHQVRINGVWCHWIHRTPQGDHLIYRQEIVAFIQYRTELQVWSKMCVSSGEVFSGPSSPHEARVVPLDTQNPVGGPFDIYAGNCHVYPVWKGTSSLLENVCIVWRGVLWAIKSA